MIVNPKARIFYVEDDESLSFVTQDNLEREGYEVISCADGGVAMDMIHKPELFDLVILDVMLPKVDGYNLAIEIRKYDKEVPILFISAKSLKEDRIHGLHIGADDYITKPFSIEELILKIEIFLRRSKKLATPNPELFRIGKYQFDYPALRLSLNESTRNLTQKEADLLKHLVMNKGEIMKRSDILEKFWGKNDYFLGRSMDVFVSRLRKYLSEDPRIQVENIHSIGYRFLIEE